MTERDKFLAWVKREVAERGLIDLRVTLAEGRHEPEDIFRGMNEINEAIAAGLATPIHNL